MSITRDGIHQRNSSDYLRLQCPHRLRLKIFHSLPPHLTSFMILIQFNLNAHYIYFYCHIIIVIKLWRSCQCLSWAIVSNPTFRFLSHHLFGVEKLIRSALVGHIGALNYVARHLHGSLGFGNLDENINKNPCVTLLIHKIKFYYNSWNKNKSRSYA